VAKRKGSTAYPNRARWKKGQKATQVGRRRRKREAEWRASVNSRMVLRGELGHRPRITKDKEDGKSHTKGKESKENDESNGVQNGLKGRELVIQSRELWGKRQDG